MPKSKLRKGKAQTQHTEKKYGLVVAMPQMARTPDSEVLWFETPEERDRAYRSVVNNPLYKKVKKKNR